MASSTGSHSPVIVVTGTSGAGKGTIERSLLARMPELELAVSATRAQEIAGEVSVVMTLQPTFSIEYIVVTMFLK